MAKLMLYKKIHRQHLREWKVGRRFKFEGEVFEIINEPVRDNYDEYIWGDGGDWHLISLKSGRLYHKDGITWLN